VLQKGVNNSVELLTLVFAVWFLNVEIIMKMEIEIFIYNFSNTSSDNSSKENGK
jgi:hypothetical protein